MSAITSRRRDWIARQQCAKQTRVSKGAWESRTKKQRRREGREGEGWPQRDEGAGVNGESPFNTALVSHWRIQVQKQNECTWLGQRDTQLQSSQLRVQSLLWDLEYLLFFETVGHRIEMSKSDRQVGYPTIYFILFYFRYLLVFFFPFEELGIEKECPLISKISKIILFKY
jgi:hypothetical protein